MYKEIWEGVVLMRVPKPFKIDTQRLRQSPSSKLGAMRTSVGREAGQRGPLGQGQGAPFPPSEALGSSLQMGQTYQALGSRRADHWGSLMPDPHGCSPLSRLASAGLPFLGSLVVAANIRTRCAPWLSQEWSYLS